MGQLKRTKERASRIANELRNSQSFKDVLDDFRATKQRVDDCWHLVNDQKQLDELRVTKLAAVSVLSILDNYESDAMTAGEELLKLEHKDAVINKYYDEEEEG